jgi:hypothetical protein
MIEGKSRLVSHCCLQRESSVIAAARFSSKRSEPGPVRRPGSIDRRVPPAVLPQSRSRHRQASLRDFSRKEREIIVRVAGCLTFRNAPIAYDISSRWQSVTGSSTWNIGSPPDYLTIWRPIAPIRSRFLAFLRCPAAQGSMRQSRQAPPLRVGSQKKRYRRYAVAGEN